MSSAFDFLSGWWLDDFEGSWYIMFSSSITTNPLMRVQWTNPSAVVPIYSPAGGDNAWPIVDRQVGDASGRWVVFTRDETTGPRDLWRVRGDGTGEQNLTSSASYDERDVAWTSNGSLLYVRSTWASVPQNIYLLSPGSSAPGAKLTAYNSSQQVESPRWCTAYNWETETWEDRIVFAMKEGSGDWDIFMGVYTGDTNEFQSNLQQLTNTSSVDERYPTWSPYCNRIAFVSNQPGQWDVFHMSYDGSDYDGSFYGDSTKRLTNDSNMEAYPVWRPIE
jgi:Tol biopolymer transport system component